MLGKLRPVGSRVPLPSSETVPLPWSQNYTAKYCASGTDALALAIGLAVLKKPEVARPEVIIPAYGCPDLVAAILSQGACPVLVDLAPESPFMDSQGLRDAVTARTVAVVGVGLLGIPERLELLAKICEDHALALIEDSAQCFPPYSAANPLAEFVVLSFGRGKPINLMGGGALLYRGKLTVKERKFVDGQSIETLKTGITWQLKRHLFNLLMTRIGFFLLEKIPGIGLGKTRFKPHPEISMRIMPSSLLFGGIKNYGRQASLHFFYEKVLRDLENTGWVLLNSDRFSIMGHSTESPRLRFGLLAPNRYIRDRAVNALNSAGIGANGLYEVVLSSVEDMPPLGHQPEFPIAVGFAERLLTLPCHEDVTKVDVNRVAEVLVSVGAKCPHE